MKKITLAVLMACVAWAQPCAAADDPSKVVAQINDKKITLREFKAQIEEISPKLRPFIKAQKGRYLQGVVEEELLFQEAQKLKLDADAEIRKQLDQAKRRLMVQKLLQGMVKNNIQVSDQEVRDYYAKNTPLYQMRERARISMILVKDKALAEDILKKLRAGSDFAALALAHSMDSTRVRGGSLGFIEKGQWGGDFDRAAFALKPGELSSVLETPGGFQILKMTEYQPAKSRSLQEVQEAIRRQLQSAKEKKAVRDYIERLKTSSKIKVQDALLKEVN